MTRAGSLFVLCLGLAGAHGARGAVFNVTTTADNLDAGGGSLRRAIYEANQTAEADTINVPAGTYTLSRTGDREDTGYIGDLDIREEITIAGAGAGSTVIDGGGIDRVFHVLYRTATFSGLTITGGNVTQPENKAYGGAAVLGDTATIYLTDCSLINNSSYYNGGAVCLWSASSLYATNCVFSGNTVSAWYAGGIDSELNGSTSLTDCTISNNTSGFGGGGFLVGGSHTWERVTVSGNLAHQRSGGIHCTSSAVLNLINSTLSGNTAGSTGGGLYAWQSTVTISNSTVAGNQASNATSTTHGGGGLSHDEASISVRNSIVAGNTDPGNYAHHDVSGTFNSLGYNLIGVNTGSSSFVDGVNGNIVGTAASPVDPDLGPLADNGGATQTHALLEGSPAIDAIPEGGNGYNSAPAADQRQMARPEGGGVDIGAFEYTLIGAPALSWWGAAALALLLAGLAAVRVKGLRPHAC